MIKRFIFLATLISSLIAAPVYADRIKDLTSIAGARSNQLMGYGLTEMCQKSLTE